MNDLMQRQARQPSLDPGDDLGLAMPPPKKKGSDLRLSLTDRHIV
jgi:hypothetical protein